MKINIENIIVKNWYTLLLFIVFIVIMIFVSIQGSNDKEELKKYARYEIATVTKYGNSKGYMMVFYTYKYYDRKLESWTYENSFSDCKTSTSCIGYKCLLVCSARDPAVHKVYFNKPIDGDTVPLAYILEFELKNFGRNEMATVNHYADENGIMMVHYSYNYNGKEYNGSIHENSFYNCMTDSSCIGNKYLVVCSSKDPTLHQVYFDKPILADTIPISYVHEIDSLHRKQIDND